MGSKSPDHEYDGDRGDPNGSDVCSNNAGEPRGSHSARDGDGCLGDGDGGESDDEGDGGRVIAGETQVGNLNGTETPLAKAKKNRKKKSKKSRSKKQSSPPRVPLTDVFPSGKYPEGELQGYKPLFEIRPRKEPAEIRYDDRRHWNDESFLQTYRKAAEVHRQARKWIPSFAKPGKTLLEIAEGVEDSVRALLNNAGLGAGNGLKSGLAFPTGLCVNHQVAHYTPYPGQKPVILQPEDVLTVDFGVHIEGWIVDSAFTVAFEPTYDSLLAAVRDSTNTGIESAGVDVRISDVSGAIQETMESYEVEVNGRTLPIKPIRNLSGHNIDRYHIHGGKSVPLVKNDDQTKMEEGEVFAIETFGTTGRGYTVDDIGTYGYNLNIDAPLKAPLTTISARRLHKAIRENFGTIPFCRRYLERLGVKSYLAGMHELIDHDVIEHYPPLTEVKGSCSAQFEHTLLLRETNKEVLSRGDDY